MDIDAFRAARCDQWERLETLASAHRLTGEQADELVILYRLAARDLSRLRTDAPDPQLIAQLSTLVAAARARITGVHEVRVSDLWHFVMVSIPAALYRLRWWTVTVTAVEVALAVIVGIWTLHSPEAMAALGTPRELDIYAHKAFEAYYTTYSAPDFAASVWTNNARLAAVSVAGGITGVVPLVILTLNAVSIGQSGAIMADHDMLSVFFALIFPHGLLELTCVFIAGAAGLKLCWTALVPGPRSRGEALATEGRAFMTVVLALIVALGVAGLIEGFVTPAPIPWAVKIAVGVLALTLLWVYTIVAGRRAVVSGEQGDMQADDAGARQIEIG